MNDNLKIPSGPFEGPENCLIFAIVILNAIPEIIESQYGNTNHKGPEDGPITLVKESIMDGNILIIKLI